MKQFAAVTMIVLAALTLGVSAAVMQTTPKAPPTYEQVIVRSWKEIRNKILAMAKDTVYPDAKPAPSLIGWLEHQGEHYGKLVTSYRANGIVPPISRPKS